MKEITYDLYSNSQRQHPAVTHNEIRANAIDEDKLPSHHGIDELHQATIRVSSQPKQTDGNELKDIIRHGTLLLDGEVIFDNIAHDDSYFQSTTKPCLEALFSEENNPIILMLNHQLLNQNHILFSPIQYIKDDLANNGHILNFCINYINFSHKGNDSLIQIKISASALQSFAELKTDESGEIGPKTILGSTYCYALADLTSAEFKQLQEHIAALNAHHNMLSVNTMKKIKVDYKEDRYKQIPFNQTEIEAMLTLLKQNQSRLSPKIKTDFSPLVEVDCTFKLSTLTESGKATKASYGIDKGLPGHDIYIEVDQYKITVHEPADQDIHKLYQVSPHTLDAYREGQSPEQQKSLQASNTSNAQPPVEQRSEKGWLDYICCCFFGSSRSENDDSKTSTLEPAQSNNSI